MTSLLVALVGLALIVAGLAQWSAPLAEVVAGLALLRLAVLLDRPRTPKGDAQ